MNMTVKNHHGYEKSLKQNFIGLLKDFLEKLCLAISAARHFCLFLFFPLCDYWRKGFLHQMGIGIQ